MAGMRGFSFNFVKSFLISSKEFEIETEMSVFTLMNNFKINKLSSNIVIVWKAVNQT